MDEDSYISIKNNYYNFRKELEKKIKSPSISMNNEDSYLIEESWHNQLLDYFGKYDTLKEQGKINQNTDFLDFLPELEGEFINKFSEIINCVKENKKMKLINHELIKSIYEEDDLNEQYIIKYYTGNNKIIIECKNDDKKALLIVNPLNENNLEEKAYIISIKKKEKINLFEDILNLENSLKNEKIFNFNKNIISFKIYFNILKLFIHIYYYEKELKKNPENVFKENEDYYLISPNWLNNFKNYYDYHNYCEDFNTIKTKTKTKINYNNYKKFMKSILNYRNNINFFDDKLYKYISNNEEIICMPKKFKKKFNYFSNCYIINSEIMNIIKAIYEDNLTKIKKRKIKYENKTIYLIYSTKITIGNLNEDLLFIPKYIFEYNSPEIFESEKEGICYFPIKRYIKSFNCDLNNYEIQSLINEENIECGQLLILLNQKDIKKESFQITPKNLKLNLKKKKNNISKSRNESPNNNIFQNEIIRFNSLKSESHKKNCNNNPLLNEEQLNHFKELQEKKINDLMKENAEMKQKYETKENQYINQINNLKEKIKNNNKIINELDIENKKINIRIC